jgi:hypothetical protein
MKAPYTLSRAIVDVFEAAGELEWARFGGALSDGSQLESPPLVVWRFKKPKEDVENKIVDAVNSFQGNVKWTIYFGGKNWVLEPERVKQFLEAGNYRIDVDGFVDIGKLEPELVRAANHDLLALAEHIRLALKSPSQS